MAQLVFAGRDANQTLADVVGYVPANFNMLPWGKFAPASNFTDAQWTLTRSSITTGIANPYGSLNAQRLIPSTANNTHYVTTDVEMHFQHPIPIKVSAIIQAGGYTRAVLYWKNFHDANSVGSVGFDLTGGNHAYDIVEGSAVDITDTAAQSLGGGWWLCSFVHHYVTPMERESHVWQPELRVDNGTGTAARSVSFAGDGTSGVNVWWFNILPKAAWDLTHKAFEDDFDSLATIDLANSKAPGFKWYINNLYEDSFMPTFGWETNPPSAPSDPEAFTISSPSVLRIYTPGVDGAAAGWNSQLWSTVTDGAGDVIGYSHKPPLVYDGYVNWDGDPGAFNPQWSGYAAFWGMPIEALQDPSISGMEPEDHFNELDVSEAQANARGSSLHDWSVPASPVRTTVVGGLDTAFPMVLGTFRRLSALWLRPEDTGTDWGIFMFFVDGRFGRFADGEYSATEGDQPGIGAGSDEHHMNVILNSSGAVASGDGQAFFIDWVKVYTKP